MSSFGLKESGLWFRVDKLLTSRCISAILHPRRTSYKIREGSGDKLRSKPREKPETCSHHNKMISNCRQSLPKRYFFLWANYISLQGTVQSYPWQWNDYHIYKHLLQHSERLANVMPSISWVIHLKDNNSWIHLFTLNKWIQFSALFSIHFVSF